MTSRASDEVGNMNALNAIAVRRGRDDDDDGGERGRRGS